MNILKRFWNWASKRPELSWRDEFRFWSKKSQRAFIRFEDAQNRGDTAAAKLAAEQHAEYSAKMNAAVPPDVQERWNRQREAERKAALEEV